jgi:Ca-activated chloride channel family protein
MTALTLAGLIVVRLMLMLQVPPVSDPRLEITSPGADSYVSGTISIAARLVPLATERDIVRMSFFADGALACVVERRPFVCGWTAKAVRSYDFRVVAELTEGRRLVTTVRTKGAEHVESTGVSAVAVPVSVKDGNGRFLRGLAPADFAVSEAGVRQAITGFAAEQAAVNVALALDTSDSMARALPSVKVQATEFLSALPGNWPTTILSFDTSVYTIAPAGLAPEERAKAIGALKAFGGTALYSAVARGLQVVEGGTGRKAVIVFTDGDDRSSTISARELRSIIEASDAVVYFVAAGEAANTRATLEVIENLATISGGRVLRGGSDESVRDAFAGILEELRNQYLLTYVPPRLAPPGTWLPLSVKVNCRDCRVRARTGYRVVVR